MAKSMDQDTILFKFKGNKKALAYNFNLLQSNSDKINHLIQDPEDIYYKVTNSTDSWIRYRDATQTIAGTHRERMLKALELGNYTVDVKDIPACTYTNVYSEIFDIIPYDGKFVQSDWVQRLNFNMDKVEYEIRDNDVIVKFDPSDTISDSIFTLNSFFHPFEISDPHTIVFPNVVDELTRIKVISDGATKNVELQVNAYSWRNTKILKPITMNNKIANDFVASVEVPECGILVYKGIMYNYEVASYDNTRIQIKGVPSANLDLFEPHKILVYPVVSRDSNVKLTKYVNFGIANKYRNAVDFVLPVKDSLITFNGVDHEYEITHRMAIHYPKSLLSINQLSRLSHVNSVNFTRG